MQIGCISILPTLSWFLIAGLSQSDHVWHFFSQVFVCHPAMVGCHINEHWCQLVVLLWESFGEAYQKRGNGKHMVEGNRSDILPIKQIQDFFSLINKTLTYWEFKLMWAFYIHDLFICNQVHLSKERNITKNISHTGKDIIIVSYYNHMQQHVL